jgi:hypothetical protein
MSAYFYPLKAGGSFGGEMKQETIAIVAAILEAGDRAYSRSWCLSAADFVKRAEVIYAEAAPKLTGIEIPNCWKCGSPCVQGNRGSWMCDCTSTPFDCRKEI